MAPRLKQLIHEIHRRSLWQVLTVYLGASWIVLEAANQVIERYLLPEWVYPAALIILLVGLPIVLATALVREDREPAALAEPRDPTLLGDTAAVELDQPAQRPKPEARLLTWPRAILGGVLAFTALGLISAWIVVRGTARVTEAYGAAGDAFGERAWIVVAEFAAPESEADVALAAQTALAIDLQQSQYVNVRGRNQIASVLRRMGLPDTTTLDEGLALEVAEREGLSAVLAPAVSRLGDDYVFSARVVQPGTGEELIAVRAAASANRLLDGVETLSREVRRRLGEERAEIRRSRPLPEVTTRSLEALKVYARAVQALERDYDNVRATELAQESIRLDSTFAMAYRLAAVALRNQIRGGEAAVYATHAYELRNRLTDRERLHVEAYYHHEVTLDPRRAADVYELILSQYPDDDRATNNLGVVVEQYLGDPQRAYEAYLRAMELNPYLGLAHSNTTRMAVRLGRWEVADSLMSLAEERGFARRVELYRIGKSFALGELGRADVLCDSLLRETSSAVLLAYNRRYCGSIDIARGRVQRGVDRLSQAAAHFAEHRQYWDLHLAVVGLVLAEQMRSRSAAARSHLESMLDRFVGDSIPETDRRWIRPGLLVLTGVLGQTALLDRVDTAYPPHSDASHWLTRYAEGIGGAATALAHAEPERAIEVLRDGTAGDYEPGFSAGLVNLVFGLAFDELGTADSAIPHLESAIGSWQLASAWSSGNFYLPFVLLRLAELEESRGNTDAAVAHYQRFLELWSDPDPEVRDQVDSARRALARLTGAESS